MLRSTFLMTKIIFLTLLIAGIFTAASLATNEAYAAIDMFLKIDGIEGESTDEGHEGEIQVESLQWGVDNKVKNRGGGGGPGKVTIQDLSFLIEFEKASPKLMEACAEGKQIPEAVLTLRKGSNDKYLTITLTDVIISSYETETSMKTAQLDKVSLNFSKIEFEYQQRDRDGNPIDEPVTGSASKHGRK